MRSRATGGRRSGRGWCGSRATGGRRSGRGWMRHRRATGGDRAGAACDHWRVDAARRRQAFVAGLAVVAAGCGGGSRTASKTTAVGRPATPAPAAVVAVVRDWSSELAGGHVAAASAYFATPSVLQVDPNYPAVALRTRADVQAANRAFPCGARLLSARLVDGYVDALFLLGDRPGGGPGWMRRGDGPDSAGRPADPRRADRQLAADPQRAGRLDPRQPGGRVAGGRTWRTGHGDLMPTPPLRRSSARRASLSASA